MISIWLHQKIQRSTKYCCNRSFFASIIYVDEFASLWICICTFFCSIIISSQVKYLMFFRLIIISSQVKCLMPFFWKNSFQIISPIRWQMGDEVWKPTDVQFYIFIYSRRVLFYPENILVDYVCRNGFNLWILDFIDFCETTSDRHFLFNSENKVLYDLIFFKAQPHNPV